MCVLDGQFYASTRRWSLFTIDVVLENGSSDRYDDVISYGSKIVLTDVDTGTRSEQYVVSKAGYSGFKSARDSVRGLHTLYFHWSTKDESSVYLAMSTELFFAPGSESFCELPLRDEGRTGRDANRKPGSLPTRASWTIVPISYFSFSFFDLLGRIPSVGLSPTVNPFPVMLYDVKLGLLKKTISARISNYFYTDRETGQQAPLEVWLGTQGPFTLFRL
jgi:hypothetical protein